MVLEDKGYDVVATDDRQALQTARANPPAVVLLDLLMPTRTGDEICRQLRTAADTATIPVVAMSAGSNLDAVGAAPFDGWLLKPFGLHALFDVLARWTAVERWSWRQSRTMQDMAESDDRFTEIRGPLSLDELAARPSERRALSLRGISRVGVGMGEWHRMRCQRAMPACLASH